MTSPIPNAKPFVKGDPRINRKGRPKNFDQLRALAQIIANEKGADGPNGEPHSNAEMALRKIMKDDPMKFLEVAYGKVPNDLNLNNSGTVTLEVIYQQLKENDK